MFSFKVVLYHLPSHRFCWVVTGLTSSYDYQSFLLFKKLTYSFKPEIKTFFHVLLTLLCSDIIFTVSVIQIGFFWGGGLSCLSYSDVVAEMY